MIKHVEEKEKKLKEMCEVVPFGEINVNLCISLYLFVVPTN